MAIGGQPKEKTFVSFGELTAAKMLMAVRFVVTL